LDQESVDASLRRLADERRRLEGLRADYAVIVRSRFHALRVIWLSLKAMFGFSRHTDRYAAWSPGMAVSFEPQPLPLFERALPAERRLAECWASRALPPDDEPIVTVVIPVYNELAVTVRCLQSIADSWFESLRVQIVVVDDGSTDRTSEVIARLPGVDYVRNGANLGFIRGCNRGAAIARGKYVCFLNNDTTVRPAWLDYLVTTAEGDESVGAVGAKLIYPNGKLQEAGNIIWQDGTGWNYGRNGNPADARFNFSREVDYCSGAALLVRTDLFRQIGGFSEEYLPAYYEDADLCFAIRDRGFRVIYQPRSEVVHYEGLTSGTDLSSGTKRFQEINRPKFLGKWARALDVNLANDSKAVPMAAHRIRHGPTILIVDSYVPMYDRDAGSARLMEVLRILREADFQVFFLGDNYAAHQPYTGELQALGVGVLHHTDGGMSMHEALEMVLPMLDLAWICRPELFEKYEPLVRRNAATKVLYDTIDLHFVRKRREWELHGGDESVWKALERIELAAARTADATIVVTEVERGLLVDRGIGSVHVVPTLHEPIAVDGRRFADTAGLLFIGGYSHTPNVDAAIWLCNDIMPRVWEKHPEIVVTLLGSNPTAEISALASSRVSVPGYVHDVEPYFTSARLFVAPLRFGAGMKGKVGHALSYGLPTILTDVAAEGFELGTASPCLHANDAQSFADAILRAYDDPALWAKLSERASAAIAPFGRAVVGPRLTDMLQELSERDRAMVGRD
jgi:GT2 family glycosyltransferase/glycosyltransferase involved in cell wall biosynthesis